jgi:osmoprotectant transport system substrate-binding protein
MIAQFAPNQGGNQLFSHRIVHGLALAALLLIVPTACQPPATAPATALPPAEAVTEAPPATPEATVASTPEGAAAGAVVKVGSKNFTESFILAELYALALENAGLKVERKLNLGATDVAQAALQKGDIDLYPEYTSTGLLTVLKLPAQQDKDAIFKAVKDGYAKQFNLVWLDPAPFNNPQALATTKTVAEKYHLKTYSDLSKAAPSLVFGAPPEFYEREDGLPGLKKAYGGFEFKTGRQLDPGLRYPALQQGQIDVTVAFGTDGQINGFGLVLLEDDKALYPPYQAAPVVRQAALEANPGIAAALNAVSPLLTTEVMQALNWKVDGPDKLEPAEVAKTFLQAKGLLK